MALTTKNDIRQRFDHLTLSEQFTHHLTQSERIFHERLFSRVLTYRNRSGVAAV